MHPNPYVRYRTRLALACLVVALMCSTAFAAPQIIYEQYTAWNSDLPFIEGSESASDVVPDPLNWENRKAVGDLISISNPNSNVTRVDVLLGQWLNRSFSGELVLKFFESNGGVPGAQFFETTSPISSDHTSGGAHQIDSSFCCFSKAVPKEFFYSVGIRDVSYTGGTGGYYLAQTGHSNTPTVGSSDAGYWELTADDVWQRVTTTQNANVRVWAETDQAIDFGKKWVRSHPFTFTGRMDWTNNQSEFDLILNSQLNAAHSGYPDTLYFAGQNDLPWHGWRQHESLATVTQWVTNYDGNIGWLNFDEPNRAGLASVGQKANELKSLTPDAIVYTSAHSKGSVETSNYSYTDYLNDMIDIAGSHVLLSNTYPFKDNGTTDINRWFDHVTALRSVGLARDVPYWMWVQSTSFPGHRLPSESDIRMSVFSALSAGYTGILLYRYHAPAGFAALLEDDRITPSSLYVPVANTANEVANLGESLRFLTSTDLRFISGGVSSTPTGLTAWGSGTGTDIGIVDISINAPPTAGKDGLIGLFTDDDGDNYFMLVNLNHGAGLSSAVASVNFTIEFDSAIDRVWRLNRLSGTVEELILTSHILELTLPGGTGDLFKLGNGKFAGLGLPGDFNGDGRVDAADYVSWRKGLNSKYTQDDYNVWRSNFGRAGAAELVDVIDAFTTIPEPSASSIAFLFGVALVLRRPTSACEVATYN